jgi:uncharacterized protein (DUF433 family)
MKLKFDATHKFSDPREMPAYSIPAAAHYLRIPLSTLRTWVLGYSYTGEDGKRHRYKPVINLPENTTHLLSFFNLAEAHVLRAFRTKHELKLPQIRYALDYITERMNFPHPLITAKFKTDGVNLLFNDEFGRLIDASGRGQFVFEQVQLYLNRLDFEQDLAARLYPFTHNTSEPTSPRAVFIDPRYSFGRPVLARIHIPTSAIADRYKAGESVDDLVCDYECERLDIEEAIRCELYGQAA